MLQDVSCLIDHEQTCACGVHNLFIIFLSLHSLVTGVDKDLLYAV